MTSLPSGIQPHSSTIVEVAQVTQPNPTMELMSTDANDVIIPSAHSSGSWISFKHDNYKSFSGFQPQLPTHPHNTDLLDILSDSQQQSSNPFYPSATPVWSFYSLAAKGLCKRVEDVKMNRIDKLRAGRRRRPCRRPFVFKSSPLAEGQGLGRFTHFRANTLPQPSASGVSSLTCNSADGTGPHRAIVYSGEGNVHISRFLDSRDSAIQHWLGDQHHEKPLPFSAINRNFNSQKQPQISRLRNCKANSTKSTPASANNYQSWEISLPKCSLPKMGMFSN